MLAPARSWSAHEPELKAAAMRVLESGRYILGPEVEAFEAACANYLGCKHALGVSSGTDALLVALMAQGVQPGDEVILPSYTFFATAGSVARLGALPVFVDSCPACYNLLPEQVAEKITAKTRAIIPVHLFGQAADLAPIIELAGERRVAVIEDACQAIGAEHTGRRVGSIATMGCFSFFPSKNLGGFGDAGLFTTSDDALLAKARALRSHGEVARYDHQTVGGNFRIDALQAALLHVKLGYLEADTAARRRHAEVYMRVFSASGVAASLEHAGERCAKAALADVALFYPTELRGRHVFNQYVIRVPGRRDVLRAHLGEQGVDTAVYYPVPLHLQRAFGQLGHKAGDFPHAEAAAADSLALPIAAELTDDEIMRVAECVVQFLSA